MTMQELERDICADLRELSDAMSQYSFLLACGKELPEYPAACRIEKYRIPECQAGTWVYAEWTKDGLVFLADSESLIVRGALALLLELYAGRSREEVMGYTCGLFEEKQFTQHFTFGQLRGLRSILASLKSSEGTISGTG